MIVPLAVVATALPRPLVEAQARPGDQHFGWKFLMWVGIAILLLILKNLFEKVNYSNFNFGRGLVSFLVSGVLGGFAMFGCLLAVCVACYYLFCFITGGDPSHGL